MAASLTPRNLTEASWPGIGVNIAQVDIDAVAVATPEEMRVWMLGNRALGTLVGLPYTFQNDGSARDAYFGEAMWIMRAAVGWKRVRGSVNATDRALIDTWLQDQAGYMYTMLTTQLSTPQAWFGRMAGNYTPSGYSSYLAGLEPLQIRYSGQFAPFSSQYHNNRRFAMELAVCIIGDIYDNQLWLDEAKRFVKEWVMFGVWEDGAQGEWTRADDYNVAHQGLIYGASNIGCALEIAARLYLRGDRELQKWSTLIGGNGTECTNGKPKTIWTAMDTQLDIMAGTRVEYSHAGNKVDWWGLGYFGAQITPMHWEYFLRPAKILRSYGRLARLLRIPSRAGWSEDWYFAPWRGFSALYGDDTRTGITEPTHGVA